MVAPSPVRGGAEPTAWWHQADQIVAPSPPHGVTKPTARLHETSHVVAPTPCKVFPHLRAHQHREEGQVPLP